MSLFYVSPKTVLLSIAVGFDSQARIGLNLQSIIVSLLVHCPPVGSLLILLDQLTGEPDNLPCPLARIPCGLAFNFPRQQLDRVKVEG
jgi:hypothetical protein